MVITIPNLDISLLTVRDRLWNVHSAGAKFRQIPRTEEIARV
jgi:hypothetical protein